jgi:uncharacterized protein YdhG (YjbR/CyaY superfamily)
MRSDSTPFVSIDAYIATFPPETQKRLDEVRATIKAAAPEAQEKISYQMPTFYLHGNLVHFAAHKNHIGFYPTPSGVQAFEHELSQYETSKGSVQFPFDKPIPLDLITKIVLFRVSENLNKKK